MCPCSNSSEEKEVYFMPLKYKCLDCVCVCVCACNEITMPHLVCKRTQRLSLSGDVLVTSQVGSTLIFNKTQMTVYRVNLFMHIMEIN